MQTPLRISFRHMEPSAAVEARVREHLERLERFHEDIIGCHVIIEAPPAHRRHGAPFDVTIDLTIPGREIAFHTGHAERAEHEDVYVAIRDGFDRVKRLLHEQERGKTRIHPTQSPP
ncbi:HPF/RaiA family ribosome-associated protein [Peristeroidobacter soli]|jgi:ribosomal subunit interface protein|uniref:HPF/RaiA family ribosome-associated protein n=1 Tax=Peristeroidobacter soli TaxID=2497877 RepID=UPI00101D3A14|nr:HPF/RaiA family ribosome-associated protein [Peristeroidobacter soli]